MDDQGQPAELAFLAFVRQRHGLENGDLDRTHRQQAFLLSIMHELQDSGALGNLDEFRALMAVARKDIVLSQGWGEEQFSRMAALAAGYDTSASGMTLDRFCGGGITSVNLATAAVMSGMEDCVIAGGTEMMSYTAQVGAEEANAGIRPMGMGSGNPALDAMHPQSHQGVCGDAIAAIEGIDRHALDALALVSQERAARAIKEGRFDKSLVTVYNDDGSVALDHEEFPRPETTAEGLAGLKASF